MPNKKWYEVDKDIASIQKRDKKMEDITTSIFGKKPTTPKKPQDITQKPKIKKK